MAAPMNNIRVLELYSGIGGMHYALKVSGTTGEVVAAVDINTVGNAVYKHNFPGSKLLQRSIESLSVAELNKLKVDMILMSPPCQPFTRVGNLKDDEDERTKSLLYLIETIPKLEHPPQSLLLENVKGFDTSQTRLKLLAMLKDTGYHIQEYLLTPLQFGIPNSRLRYYLIARKSPFPFTTTPEISDTLPHDLVHERLCNIPSLKVCGAQSQGCEPKVVPGEPHDRLSSGDIETDPNPCATDSGDISKHTNESSAIESGTISKQPHESDKYLSTCQPLSSFLETENEEYFTEFLLSDKQLKLYGCMDIVNSLSRKSCCFTKRYGHYMDGAGSVIQMNSNAKISWKSEPDESDLAELRTLKLRYFTPREIANLLSFPSDFDFPSTVTLKQKYRVLGNSLNVFVVALLINVMVM